MQILSLNNCLFIHFYHSILVFNVIILNWYVEVFIYPFFMVLIMPITCYTASIHILVLSDWFDSEGDINYYSKSNGIVFLLNFPRFQKMSRTLHVKRDGVSYSYTLLDKLGKGSFSQVFKCVRIMEGKEDIFVWMCFIDYY